MKVSTYTVFMSFELMCELRPIRTSSPIQYRIRCQCSQTALVSVSLATAQEGGLGVLPAVRRTLPHHQAAAGRLPAPKVPAEGDTKGRSEQLSAGLSDGTGF